MVVFTYIYGSIELNSASYYFIPIPTTTPPISSSSVRFRPFPRLKLLVRFCVVANRFACLRFLPFFVLCVYSNVGFHLFLQVYLVGSSFWSGSLLFSGLSCWILLHVCVLLLFVFFVFVLGLIFIFFFRFVCY
jgi:hypothetical protein